MTAELAADEFYRRRDDRTNRYAKYSREYQNFHIRLVADESTVETYAGQVQLLLVANMLSRWCRWVEFGFPDAPLAGSLRINGSVTLHKRISAEVSNADPFGRFDFLQGPSPDVQYTLAIGKVRLKEPASFAIDANGWNIWASSTDFLPAVPGIDTNPIGPAFAACVGVADAFKVATGQQEGLRIHELALSLLNFERSTSPKLRAPLSGPVNIGNAQLIGVGSVGSAAIYLLRMIPLQGYLTLIDHDPVEIENLNRSPLFGVSDIDKSKVVVGAEYLTGHLPTEAFPGLYSDFIGARRRKPGDVDIVLPFANDYGVRYQIENNFPPLQVYGTTTPSWGINYHRHIPLTSDCSVCRFPELGGQVQFVCSTAKIPTPNDNSVDAALPFLSVGAAVLAVADLIKLQMPGYPFTPNFAFFDFLGKLETISAFRRRMKAGCICVDRSPTIHSEYIGSTRYYSLSTTDHEGK